MATNTRRLISFDWAIKKILRSKANFEILEGFLSELLYDDIKITEILESKANQDTYNDKFNRLDIKVKNSKNEVILIEIQYTNEYDYLQRVLYNTSKAIVEHIKKGQPYSKVIKVISINILYFDLGKGKGDDYIYKGTTSFVGLNDKTPLTLTTTQSDIYNIKTDKIESLYPEYYLIKVKNFDDVAKNTLDEWIYFLKNEEVQEDFKAKGLEQAKEVLDYLKLPIKERIAYSRYEDDLHYQASMHESNTIGVRLEGKLEGKLEGEKEKALEIAKTMLVNGFDIDTIIKITGLSKEIILH